VGESGPGQKSVWWEWIAPVTGVAAIRAESAEYSAGVGVYTGNNIGTLTLVAARANNFDVNEVTFNVTAGTAYQISVDGFHFAVGTASGKYKLSGSMQGLENFKLQIGQTSESGTGLSASGLSGMEVVLQFST